MKAAIILVACAALAGCSSASVPPEEQTVDPWPGHFGGNTVNNPSAPGGSSGGSGQAGNGTANGTGTGTGTGSGTGVGDGGAQASFGGSDAAAQFPDEVLGNFRF